MIGLKQLASLLAGAVVLFGSVLIPAGGDEAVAIETLETGETQALADQPARIDLGSVKAFDLITSRGAPAPPATLEGGFETVRFVTSATDGSTTAELGGKDVPIPAGSEVLVEGLSGTLDVDAADPGVSVLLTGTATRLQVDPPSAPAVGTYQGARSDIPVTNLTLDGEPVTGAGTHAGEYSEIAFQVEAPGKAGEAAPTLTTGPDTLPFRQSARVLVADYAGVVAVVEVDEGHLSLKLDGFGNVTVLDERIDPEVSREVDADVGVGEPNAAPEAEFTYRPQSPEAKESVYFESESSDDVAIRSWDWSFGDGSSSQAQDPEHRFPTDGTFRVTLTVTDALGRSDTETKVVEVVNSRPIVSIDGNRTPTEGREVTYTADAKDRDGDIVSYDWSLPDNGTDTGTEINHTFPRDDAYEIGLTVIDEEGAKAHTNATIDVQNAPPIANFTIDPKDPTVRQTVFLESTSTDYGDGKIVEHNWNIESVGARNGEVVKTEFQEDGFQEVRLTVRDDDGSTTTTREGIFVSNAPPDADIGISPELPNPDETVRFSANVEDDDPMEEVRWEFEDGKTLEGLKVKRSFVKGGTRDVTLFLEDTDGAEASFTKTFHVNHAPSVELGPEDRPPADEVAVQTSEDLVLTARVDDPDHNTSTLGWSVDGEDPQQSDRCTLAPDGNRSRLACSWPDDGQHRVRVHAEDPNGASGTASSDVSVLNRPPTLNPDVITGVVNVGETITLQSAPDDPDGEVVEVLWKVDGKKIGLGSSIDHKFEESGTHKVVVKGTDDDGAITTASFDVEVNERPTVDFTFTPEDPVAGDPIDFQASASDPDGADSALEYAWDFGDGDTDTGVETSHVYDLADNYDVTLTVTDEAGAETVVQKTARVSAPPLDAKLDIDPKSPQVGDDVQFTLQVRDGREIESIEWAFGDGATETTGEGVQTTKHVYDRPGSYPVRLTVEADHGDTRRVSTSVRVTGPGSFDLVFEPRLPTGQCLNLDSPEVSFEAINLATGTTIALEGGDQQWDVSKPCTTRYTFPSGTWAYDDRLKLILGLGPAETERHLEIQEGTELVDRDLRLHQAPLALEDAGLVSPGQSSGDENDTTFRDPTDPVFLTARVVWADGTLVRHLPIELASTYRGPPQLSGPGIQYYDETVEVPDDGQIYKRIPAPVLGAETPGSKGPTGPQIAYPPGQYTVKASVHSGLFNDVARLDFLEDPAGILQAIN